MASCNLKFFHSFKYVYYLILPFYVPNLHLIFFSEVFPMQMEGVRLVVNKGLSNHFQVSKVACLH